MRHVIIATVILFVVVGGLVYADSKWGEQDTIVPSSPIVVPVYITAVPAIPDAGDLWGCLQENTGASDRNRFLTIGLSSEYDGRIFTYQVFNVARDEVRAVTVEYVYDNTGQVSGHECTVPNEWTNGGLLPGVTPYPTPTISDMGGIGGPAS